MQPTSPRTRHSVPPPRARSVGSPYPGPYAYNYAGPPRPYPELRESGGGPDRMPRTALTAGVLGIVGVAPLLPLTIAAVMFGGLWGDADVEWWLYLLPAAPIVQAWGAIWLLGRRNWLFPALSFLLGTGIFAFVVVGELTQREALDLGWYTVGLVFPLAALVLTPLPPVRRWIRTRPRAGRVAAAHAS